jgi:hypothetical protein
MIKGPSSIPIAIKLDIARGVSNFESAFGIAAQSNHCNDEHSDLPGLCSKAI